MIVKMLSDNNFLLSNDNYTVECDLKFMTAAILKNGELENYCSLKFSDKEVFNFLQVIDVVRHKTLFEVEFKGDNIKEWIEQLIKAFSDYLKDPEVITGYYNISGIEIPLIL